MWRPGFVDVVSVFGGFQPGATGASRQRLGPAGDQSLLRRVEPVGMQRVAVSVSQSSRSLLACCVVLYDWVSPAAFFCTRFVVYSPATCGGGIMIIMITIFHAIFGIFVLHPLVSDVMRC